VGGKGQTNDEGEKGCDGARLTAAKWGRSRWRRHGRGGDLFRRKNPKGKKVGAAQKSIGEEDMTVKPGKGEIEKPQWGYVQVQEETARGEEIRTWTGGVQNDRNGKEGAMNKKKKTRNAARGGVGSTVIAQLKFQRTCRVQERK